MKRLFIALIGEMVCGKGTFTKTVIDFVSSEEFAEMSVGVHSTSNLLKDILTEQLLITDPTREDLQALEEALEYSRNRRISHSLVNSLVAQMSVDIEPEVIIVDSIRTVKQFGKWKENFPKMKMVYICASPDNRYEWDCKRRDEAGREPFTYRKFTDMHLSPTEKEIPQLISLADEVINNHKGLDDFKNEVIACFLNAADAAGLTWETRQ